MKRRNLLLILATVLILTGAVAAQQSQTQSQSTQQKMNEDRLEAAHGAIISSQDKAKEASRLTEAVASALPASGSSSAPVPRKNFIDEYIFGRMEGDNIPHAPVAGDEEFLRRAYLDATGLLPTPDEVRAFIADTDPNKRDKLVDSLIGTEEFADQWAYHYGELLRTREAGFHIWTKDWLRVDRPYNEVFADMVTPTTKNAKGFPTALTFYDPIGYIANRCGTWTDADNYKLLKPPGLDRRNHIRHWPSVF